MDNQSDDYVLHNQIGQLQIGESIDLSSIGYPVYVERSSEASYNAAPSDHSAPEQSFEGIGRVVEYIKQLA